MTNPTTRRQFLTGASAIPFLALGGAGLAGAKHAVAQQPVSRVGGPRLKLSLNGYSFNNLLMDHLEGRVGGMSLFDVLEYCAENDFDAIDPTGYYFPGYPEAPADSFINEFKRRAFELGLDISGTGVRTDFSNPDASVRAADKTRVKTWVEVAAKMGAPVLRVFAGHIHPGFEDKWDEAASWMIDDLRECTEYGAEFGVIIGVQNHGEMIKSADETIEVVKRVDSKWFGVVVDTGNMKTADPYADIARVVPYAVNWQIKESPIDRNSKVRVDLRRLIKIIREGGYRGYIPIETLPVDGVDYDPKTLVATFAREVRAAMDEA